ncbi:hypothetical protein HY463_00920 [Candidatus Peregrinibacteria bacterium]|nr:hypothetical protein [Candidatus Peregrinibacteria bacterium]
MEPAEIHEAADVQMPYSLGLSFEFPTLETIQDSGRFEYIEDGHQAPVIDERTAPLVAENQSFRGKVADILRTWSVDF